MSLVALRTFNGHYLCAEGGGGREINATRGEAREWETFELLDLNKAQLMSTDQVALRTHNGSYASAEGGGGGGIRATVPWILGWETFTLERADGSPGEIGHGDSVALRTENGMYVCAEDGGGGEVSANRQERREWETFVLEVKQQAATSYFAAREDAVTQSGARRMYTEATYFTEGRRIYARTHTWNSVKLTGFTGGVSVLFLNSDGQALGATGLHTFGVDGTWIGRANRWDTWEEHLPPDVAWLDQVAGIAVMHTHAGVNRLDHIIDEAVRYTKKIEDIYGQLSRIAPPS